VKRNQYIANDTKDVRNSLSPRCWQHRQPNALTDYTAARGRDARKTSNTVKPSNLFAAKVGKFTRQHYGSPRNNVSRQSLIHRCCSLSFRSVRRRNTAVGRPSTRAAATSRRLHCYCWRDRMSSRLHGQWTTWYHCIAGTPPHRPTAQVGLINHLYLPIST